LIEGRRVLSGYKEPSLKAVVERWRVRARDCKLTFSVFFLL
jgi:hypothetical protein